VTDREVSVKYIGKGSFGDNEMNLKGKSCKQQSWRGHLMNSMVREKVDSIKIWKDQDQV